MNLVDMKRIALILLILSIYTAASAQNYTVNGMVKDGKTNDPIIGAAVFELSDATVGTATDTEGFFSLNFKKSHIFLKVAYIGYKDTVFEINLHSDTALIVNMLSETDISEVEVEDDIMTWQPNKDTLSGEYKKVYAGGADQKAEMPAYPFKITEPAPRKKNFNEVYFSNNSGAFGKAIYIDGAKIFFPERQSKLFSLINHNAIGAFKIHNVDYPVEYGGRVVPVLSLDMKNGAMQTYKGNANINFFGAGINAEGPIVKDVSSFFIALRKSYLPNPYTKLFAKDKAANNEYFLKPSFFDINLKYKHKIDKRNSFFASMFYNTDRIKIHNEDSSTSPANINLSSQRDLQSSYSNMAYIFNYKHIFSEVFSMNAGLIFNRYNRKQSFSGDSIGDVSGEQSYINRYTADYDFGNEDIALKIKGIYAINNEHLLNFGAEIINHHFRPVKAEININDFEHTTVIDSGIEAKSINAQEYAIYVGDNFIIEDNLKINAGLRFSAFSNSDTSFFSIEPRLFADYKFSDFVSFQAAYAFSKEYLHLLRGSSSGLSNDIFTASSKNILPQNTHHAALGIKADLPFDIKLDGNFHINFISNFYDYKDFFSYFNYPDKAVLTGLNIEERIASAKGNQYGLQIALSKTYKNLSVSTGYTLSLLNLSSDSINAGQSYPYTGNRSNEFKLNLRYFISDNIRVFAEWFCQSGNYINTHKQHYIPYDYKTGSLGTNKIPNMPQNIVSSYRRNNYRLPAYHRLDIGAEYLIGNHTIGIHIYNVYNRRNTDLLDYKKGVFTNGYANELAKYGSMPFLPTISYSYKL